MKKSTTKFKQAALIVKASIPLVLILMVGSMTYGRDGFAVTGWSHDHKRQFYVGNNQCHREL